MKRAAEAGGRTRGTRTAGNLVPGRQAARVTLVDATTPDQLAVARALFEEYAAWLGVDLAFQGFAAELASLPGSYAPPHGRLLLAFLDSEAVGCVALRPLGKGICEMKRLFVRGAWRRQGVGRLLTERVVQEARSIGYRTMRLDTLASMRPAIELYEALGFARCAAYYDTPLADTLFLELPLARLPH
jgi:putative acetyltransferase